MSSSHSQQTTPPTPYRKTTSLGVLRGRVVLHIQTHQAQRLIRGRRGREGIPAILGLIGFAERLKVLWQGAREEDPYAHWWLLKVDRSLKQGRQCIEESHGLYKRVLEQECALEVSTATSTKPQQVVLQFANPYAFLGAQMLAEFDRLICTQLTLDHIGWVVSPNLVQSITAAERKIRSAFLVPQGYHYLGIDVAAVRQGTKKAQRALEKMGEVPEEILRGEHKAPLAPKRKRTVQRVRDTVSDNRADIELMQNNDTDCTD